mmetsp:Transcript_11141/g.31970  ORF Transcript_11141/g.31970 Transcript_11141/m.31970 type:complete len:236 (-) Transcript_11141:343-1050(-)
MQGLDHSAAEHGAGVHALAAGEDHVPHDAAEVGEEVRDEQGEVRLQSGCSSWVGGGLGNVVEDQEPRHALHLEVLQGREEPLVGNLLGGERFHVCGEVHPEHSLEDPQVARPDGVLGLGVDPARHPTRSTSDELVGEDEGEGGLAHAGGAPEAYELEVPSGVKAAAEPGQGVSPAKQLVGRDGEDVVAVAVDLTRGASGDEWLQRFRRGCSCPRRWCGWKPVDAKVGPPWSPGSS